MNEYSNTFTFTFICHPGKTHNHRSRGDTPWKAQTKEYSNECYLMNTVTSVTFFLSYIVLQHTTPRFLLSNF